MDEARPPTRTPAAMTTPAKSRLRVVAVTSDLHALGAQPVFHFRLNLVQLLLCPRLEPGYQDRLGVRCADETPPVAEQHAHAVDRDDFVFGCEIFLSLFDDAELLVVRAIDPNLGGRDEAWNVGEELAHALAGVGDDAKQARSAVQGVVESVKSL